MTIEPKQNTKPDRQTHTPRSKTHHDTIFKRFFSIPAFAKELVRLMFSKTILKIFDLSKLRVENGLFGIDGGGNNRQLAGFGERIGIGRNL